MFSIDTHTYSSPVIFNMKKSILHFNPNAEYDTTNAETIFISPKYKGCDRSTSHILNCQL